MAEAMKIDLTTFPRHPRRRRFGLKRSSRIRRRSRRIRRDGRNVGPTVDAIRLINFKAFEDTGWIPFKGVTYLMGANSAGKSSILNAIKFISSVVSKDIAPFEKEESFLSEFPLSDTKNGLNLGTINDTIFDGKQSFTIQLRVSTNRLYTLTYSFKFGKPKHRDVKQITNAALLSLKILTKWGILVEWTPDKNKVKLYQSTLKDSGYKRDALKEQIYLNVKRSKKSFLRTFEPISKDRLTIKKSDQQMFKKFNDLYKGADADFLLNFIEFAIPNLFKLSDDFISDIEKKEGPEEEFDVITDTIKSRGGWIEDITDRLIDDYGENYSIDIIDNCLSLINKTFKKTKHARAKSDPKKIPGFRQFIKWIGIFHNDIYKDPRYTFEKLMNLEKFISRNPDNVNRSIELINDTAEIIYDEFMENYTPDIFCQN